MKIQGAFMDTRWLDLLVKSLFACTLAIVLAGCGVYHMPGASAGASSPAAAGYPSTSAERGAGGVDPRLESDSAAFFSKSGLQACAGGALVGVAGCMLGNPSNRHACMLKAGLAGCGVGMGVNYYLDQRRSEYSNNEQRLNAILTDVRSDNAKLQNLTQTARSVMDENRRQMEQINREIAQKTLDRSKAQKQLAEIDANTLYLKKTLAEVRAREKNWRDVAQAERNSGARVDALDAEISRLNQQASVLESEINDLYKQRSAIRLG
ncbi:hypothetical protein HDN1F_05130 [gamma proteobacterium HdN1]|nr:hypothetical protein HDN1F_05130 [gamma proteobacterium HdN1]